MDLSEYLKQSLAGGGDVPGLLNTQIPGVNHQRGLGSRVRVARGCGTIGRLGDPDHQH